MSEQEQPATPDFVGIVQAGEFEESLEAIRDLLAQRLVEATARDSATVAKQLVAVITELKKLGAGPEEDGIDDLRDDGEPDS
ncbi:hypothetical protein [Micromonospora matsumotoense]|uniref:hypothetical protein n=1 Tax=Micromonospora matsumotoense TaxID=121616 RepID=UPI003403BF35